MFVYVSGCNHQVCTVSPDKWHVQMSLALDVYTPIRLNFCDNNVVSKVHSCQAVFAYCIDCVDSFVCVGVHVKLLTRNDMLR